MGWTSNDSSSNLKGGTTRGGRSVIFMVGLGLFLTMKVADVAEDFKVNPMQGLAELAIQAHPDYDLVETDEKAGTIKVRHLKTGESATMNIADVAQGKFEVTTSEGKKYSVRVDGEGVIIKGPEGESAVDLEVTSGQVEAAVGAAEGVVSEGVATGQDP